MDQAIGLFGAAKDGDKLRSKGEGDDNAELVAAAIVANIDQTRLAEETEPLSGAGAGAARIVVTGSMPKGDPPNDRHIDQTLREMTIDMGNDTPTPDSGMEMD